LDISIHDLAETISKKSNFSGKILWDTSKPDGTPKKLLDVNRINNIGWKACINLEKGIEMAINSFKEELNNLRES